MTIFTVLGISFIGGLISAIPFAIVSYNLGKQRGYIEGVQVTEIKKYL